jgi:hypothetical protein
MEVYLPKKLCRKENGLLEEEAPEEPNIDPMLPLGMPNMDPIPPPPDVAG